MKTNVWPSDLSSSNPMAAVAAPSIPLARMATMRAPRSSLVDTLPFRGTPLVFPVKDVQTCRSRSSSSIKSQAADDRIRRRQVLLSVGTALAMSSDPARAERNSMQGFKAAIDKGDGYFFYYPFGWEEISVKGQDAVYRDIIEPLESVSVNVLKTDKKDIHEFGTPEELASVLVERFLAPSQTATLVEAKERTTDGIPFYTFEFLAKAQNYSRHALGVVTVANGKFYALVTGAKERRWNKMKDKLHTVVDSFAMLK